MSSKNDSYNYEHDPSAKKALKGVKRKQETRHRHDKKQHLKDLVDDINYGRKDKYDDYEDEE